MDRHDKRSPWLLATLPLIAVLAGCAPVRSFLHDATTRSTLCSTGLEDLREDAARAAAAPRGVADDIRTLERRFVETGNHDAQLRLAWLLARPDAGAEEERQALRLLEGLNEAGAASDGCAQALAGLLRDQLLVRQKLRGRLEDERQRREQLTVQLEALKAIERRITDRVRGPATEPVAPQEIEP